MKTWFRSVLTAIAIIVLGASPARAQITVTFTFSNGTTADATQVNTDINQLATAALNRTGGTITGNIAMANGLTLAGIDIGGTLCPTCTPTHAGLTITGAGASAISVTGGITAGSGVVGIIGTDGRIPAISSTYVANLSGANLTALNGTNVATGTIAVARGGTGADFSATAQGNVFYFSGTGALAALAPGTAGMFLRTGGAAANPTWSNDGSNLTGLNASNLASGTLPGARLSGTYSTAVTIANASNSFQGAFTAPDGSAGIDVAACNTTSGGALVFKKGILVSGC